MRSVVPLLALATVTSTALAVACAGADALAGPDEASPSAALPGDGAPPAFEDAGPLSVDARAPGTTVTCAVTPCVRRVAIAGGFGCALLADGSVRCWGDNAWGTLGVAPDGGPSPTMSTPKPVPGVAGAVDLQVGSTFACALTSTGEVWCWGGGPAASATGAVGLVAATRYPVPGPVAKLHSGGLSVCAELVDGRVFCNGYNQANSLGVAPVDAGVMVDAPRPMIDVTKPEALTLAVNVTCGLRDGGVHCIGASFNRFPGGDAGPAGPLFAAYAMPLPSRAVAFARGGYQFTQCAVLDTGATWCWGRNYGGEAAPQVTTRENIPPTRLAVDGASAIDVGLSHGCAVLGGVVRCWGSNKTGELGPSAALAAEHVAPVDVALPGRAVDVSVGGLGGNAVSCAVLETGAAYCWGSDESGGLGRGATAPGPHPVPAPVVL